MPYCNDNTLPICLLGPSCSGKSALALWLSTKIDAEIISIDSVSFYKELTIGAAKPTLAERKSVPHHLLDVCTLQQNYTVAQCVAQVHALVANLKSRNKQALLVGGSMMYFHVLLHGLSILPAVKQQRLPSLEAMYAELASLDQEAHKRLHAKDSSRITRAWQIAQTGKNLSTHWQEKNLLHPPLKARVIKLAPANRRMLDNKIAQRSAQMLASGLVQELEGILMKNPQYIKNPPRALSSVGYKQVFSYLQTDTPNINDLALAIGLATRKLVKRQTTWLKKFNAHLQLDAMQTTEQQQKKVLQWLETPNHSL